ncbi:MAG: glycosyltransferase family 4 protein [Chloroflexi bacterium]|nr:glycosyltransferase family 4 protein [Chloroflexota bacterium]
MRFAIVHDYLNQMGGAERVLMVLHDLFPDAPIFTSIYEPTLVDPAFHTMDIRTSFMQRLPLVHRHHQPFLPVFPFAFESLDLSKYDVVLSMSSAWSKAVLTRPDAVHLNYCLTPMRFAWAFDDYVRDEPVSRWQRAILAPVLSWLRHWDVKTSNRVDEFSAISTVVQQRINKYYRRDASIIYPPVDTTPFAPLRATARDGGYFVVASRLIPYKRIDLAIGACNQLRMPLKILGEGRDRARLEALAGPTIEFLGWVNEAEKRSVIANATAFIFPAEEDFGIAPVEAMAAGRPVVAFSAGGALDTVIPGKTGAFFRDARPDALASVLSEVGRQSWDGDAIAAHAARFDTETFKAQMGAWVACAASRAHDGTPVRRGDGPHPPNADRITHGVS